MEEHANQKERDSALHELIRSAFRVLDLGEFDELHVTGYGRDDGELNATVCKLSALSDSGCEEGNTVVGDDQDSANRIVEVCSEGETLSRRMVRYQLV